MQGNGAVIVAVQGRLPGSFVLALYGLAEARAKALSAYLGREESALPSGLSKQEEFKMGLVKKDDG